MRYRTLALAVAMVLLFGSFTNAIEKRGLLIVAHGDPFDAWNQPVLDVENQVKEILDSEQSQVIATVRVALMEFAEPSIVSAIADMEKLGIEYIYVLPMFIGPSCHTFYDLPTILGLYSEKHAVEQLREEGIKIVDTDMKLTIGPTIDISTITEILMDRVSELMDDPTRSALVILSHGDRWLEPLLEQQSKEIGAHICGALDIRYFDYSFVEMGQGFIVDGAPVIFRALDKYESIIVVGMYLSMGAENLVMKSSASVGGMQVKGAEMFSNHDVRFASKGLLPDKRIARWVVDKVHEWVHIYDDDGALDSHD